MKAFHHSSWRLISVIVVSYRSYSNGRLAQTSSRMMDARHCFALCAVQGGHVDCIRHMIMFKADINPESNNLRIVGGPREHCKDAGESRGGGEPKGGWGHSPLHLCPGGSQRMRFCLVRRWSNCNSENKDHASPLFIAVQKGHTVICKKLLRDSRILS